VYVVGEQHMMMLPAGRGHLRSRTASVRVTKGLVLANILREPKDISFVRCHSICLSDCAVRETTCGGL